MWCVYVMVLSSDWSSHVLHMMEWPPGACPKDPRVAHNPRVLVLYPVLHEMGYVLGNRYRHTKHYLLRIYFSCWPGGCGASAWDPLSPTFLASLWPGRDQVRRQSRSSGPTVRRAQRSEGCEVVATAMPRSTTVIHDNTIILVQVRGNTQ